jgi:hypothetical protein
VRKDRLRELSDARRGDWCLSEEQIAGIARYVPIGLYLVSVRPRGNARDRRSYE